MLRNVGLIAILNLISRLLGFISWSLIAKLIGAGQIADAFFVAFRIPNILRSLLAEGAFTSAFVPVLASDHKQGQSKVQETISSTLGLLTIVGMIITALGILFPNKIVDLVAIGFSQSPEQYETCIRLIPIMLPYVYFVSIIALINSCLNSVNKYGAASYAQIIMNIVTIIGTIIAGFFSTSSAVYILAIFVLIGGFIQVITQIPSFYKSGFKLFPVIFTLTSSTKRLIKLMIPATLSSTVYQISIFLNTLFASLLPVGSISWLTYADRITQIPIGLFTVSMGSVLLPTLSRAYHEQRLDDFAKHLNNSLRYSIFIIIPVSLALFLFCEDYITLLFQYGSFSRNDTIQSAMAVKAMSLGLIFATLSSMLSRAYLAKGNTKLPAIISVISLAFGVFFSIILMGQPEHLDTFISKIIISIQSFFPIELNLKHSALALASGLSALISTLAYFIFSKKHHLNIEYKQILLLLLKVSIICMIISIIFKIDLSRLSLLFKVIVESLLFSISYLLLGYIFKIEENKIVYQKLISRFKR